MLIFHTNVSFHGGVDASDFGNVGEQKFECLTYSAARKARCRLSLSDSRRRRYPWRVRIFLWLIFSAQAFGAGLDHYAQLVVNDSRATPRDGVRVTYLGTNGYQFEFKGHALLVDPYFSRVDLLSAALGSRIQPNASRINDGLRHLAPTSGRDSGDARTFRSPAGCSGCDGKDTGASRCVGIQCRPCQTRAALHPATQ